MALADYLIVPGVQGDAASGEFTVTSYDTGSTPAVDQPLTVDLSVVSGGSNQLALDAQNGTVLPTVTLQEVTLGGKEPTVEKITLTGATVSSVQAAGGEVAVSFNYQSETVQPYIQRPDGSIVAGTPITHTGGTFATPTPQVLPSANGADNYYLNVPGVTGPVTASGYSGDFQTTGYQFTTGPAGQAGPLLLTLQNGSDATGVSNLEQALWSNQDLGTVTLDVQKGGSTGQIETIQLSDAHVVSFTDPGGEVSVALSYSQAQVTNYTQNADGSAGTPTTVTWGASTIPSQVAPITPVALTNTAASLQVSGVLGDVASSGAFKVAGFSTGTEASGAGSTVDQPLTVDLSVVSGGSNQLALDAQNGTVLPTVTLQEVTLGGKEPTVEKITLTGATVSSVQAAGGEVAVSFNYQSETVQPYIQRPDGSIVAGTPITHTGGTFATPTPQVLPSANGADNYYLNVPGVTGPVTASGYSGDFQTTGYQFTTGPAGQAGPLLLTLQNGSDATGVSNLEQALWSNQDLGTVTLDVQKGGSTGQIETIQLSDAHVVSFTDPGGEVSVALSYSQAQVTNYTQNADGSAGTPTTVTWGASTIPSQVAPITPVALTNTAASLQVSGVLGDVASSGAFKVAGFSTGTEASGAGSTVDQPLTVDLSVVSGGSNQLALDAQNGTVLPTVTLQEVTLGGQGADRRENHFDRCDGQFCAGGRWGGCGQLQLSERDRAALHPAAGRFDRRRHADHAYRRHLCDTDAASPAVGERRRQLLPERPRGDGTCDGERLQRGLSDDGLSVHDGTCRAGRSAAAHVAKWQRCDRCLESRAGAMEQPGSRDSHARCTEGWIHRTDRDDPAERCACSELHRSGR